MLDRHIKKYTEVKFKFSTKNKKKLTFCTQKSFFSGIKILESNRKKLNY